MALLSWQELAAALPGTLQGFLAEKYGISPISGLSQKPKVTSSTDPRPFA
jgi:hypothetical protein